ncbi:vWA domain-containing protein [Acinetobacter towneri]|uniref:hypothetical protein n=1 Tax=Acinetobacter towneri TaxID=202956 RepID=UPI002934CF17|nr:hypothetical protein [Acinetobacter towneri]WOE29135.1 hypothetical protein QSG83_02715 [Acinetobacter towneri]
MKLNKQLLAMLVGTSVFLTACGGDSDSSISTKPTDPVPPEQPDETLTTIQDVATVVSEKANIAVFGAVNPKYFTETALTSGRTVLLLDDNVTKAAGFASQVDLTASSAQNQAKVRSVVLNQNLDEFSKFYLAAFTDALIQQNATVNILTNRVSTNAQGEVVNVILDIDFSNANELTKVRDLLLSVLNSNSSVTTPVVVQASDKKLRLNLSFWLANQSGYIWANTYVASNSEQVKQIYGDLNIASALSSNADIEVATVKETFTQTTQSANAVDILWNIDSSGSMSEEQRNLANGAAQFFKSLNQAGVDYRLAVNTQDAYECKSLRTLKDKTTNFIDRNTPDAEQEWATLAQPGTYGSGTETGFYCVREVDLTGFDRPNVKNLVVFVSDEPENETYWQYSPVYSNYTRRDFNDYKNYFLSTNTTYFSIVGTSDHIRPTFADPTISWSTPGFECNGQGGSAEGGGHFKEIARLTGGASASICADATSWNVVFDDIIRVATGLASQFSLKQVPVPSTVKVTVNGQNVARDTTHRQGFDLVYSNSGVSLVFYGTALPKAGETVSVSYDYFK